MPGSGMKNFEKPKLEFKEKEDYKIAKGSLGDEKIILLERLL
jgi:hypothetical protein